MRAFAHIQQASNRAHRSAPKRYGRNLRSMSNMLDNFIKVILLIEPQRHVVSLGVATSTEVKGTQRDIKSHEITQVLHSLD